MDLQDLLVEFYSEMYPQASVRASSNPSPTANHFISVAKFFSYMIKDGQRITVSSSAKNAPNSIIQMEFGGQIFVGQVISIIQHRQIGIGHPIVFTQVHWFRRSDDVDTDIWDQ